MPTDVNVAFQILADGLASSSEETRTAAKHRASLEACLTKQFGMTSFFLSGSFGHGTNILRYSDVDRFAVIPTENLLQDSNATLRKIAVALRKTFPQTGIRVDAPGLRVPFGFKNKELTEVIPADEVGQTNLGYRLFEIADGNGRWLQVAPESHTAYVTEIDIRPEPGFR